MKNEELIKRQWKIRRRMAIFAYILGLIVFPIAYIKWPVLKDLAASYYTLITFVLTAYYSFATWQDMKEKSNEE